MTMAMMSLSTGLSAFMSVINGSVDIKDVGSTLLTSGAMVCTMILWPVMSQRYQKSQRKKQLLGTRKCVCLLAFQTNIYNSTQKN